MTLSKIEQLVEGIKIRPTIYNLFNSSESALSDNISERADSGQHTLFDQTICTEYVRTNAEIKKVFNEIVEDVEK